MSHFLIRRARGEEAEQIFSIVSQTIDACYTGWYSQKIVGAFHDFHSIENIISDIERETCFVALSDGRIVGTAVADAPQVHRLFVSPDVQGKGCGSLLLRAAEEEIGKVSSYVQVDSSLPAERFYEQMGYGLKEECADEIGGETIRWKVYEKVLNNKNSTATELVQRRQGSFFDLVYEVVKKIPRGKVATYGQIARMCGSPPSSRAVGYALHVNPFPGIVPCHRVVNREGRLAPGFAFGGAEVQRDLLEREGVKVRKESSLYFVDIEQYCWKID